MYGFSEMMMEEAEKQFSQEGRETMTWDESKEEYEFYYALEDNGKLTTNVDKDLLKYWQITEGVDGNRR